MSNEHASGLLPRPGMVASQWLVRLLGLTIVLGGIFAAVSSRHEIERYARIKTM